MKKIILAAVAKNGVIGKDGKLPWHFSEDLKRFKHVTMGNPVIMGSITYRSIVDRIGKPLPGRTNIVLSFEPIDVPDDVINVHSIPDAFKSAENTGADRCFIIGGASIYEQTMELADRLDLTEVKAEYDGDTFFPDWNRDEWKEVSRKEHDEFDFVEYVRT